LASSPESPSSDTKDRCEHFADIHDVRARSNGCEACQAQGSAWNELRVCLSCGHVGCCEDSPQAHALAHFNATGHPMIASFERGETWGWCYVDRRYFDPMPEPLPKRRSALGALLGRLVNR
jgi:uncharacterized UBP type Zn finger protein